MWYRKYTTLWGRIVVVLELAIIAGSLAALVQCFIRASEPDASQLFLLGGVIFTVLLFGSFGDCARRIINDEKLKSRLLKLTELYKEGDILRLDAFNKIKNDSQKDEWWPKVDSWKDEVCSVMNAIRRGDCERWLSLNEYIGKHTMFNEDMSNKADSLEAWVGKLREYIESRAKNEPKVD